MNFYGDVNHVHNVPDVPYYARSANAQGERETVQHHLIRVAELCGLFLEPIGYSDLGQFLGALHDFGKYSPLFSDVLAHRRVHVNHAAPGAALAWNTCRRTRRSMARILAAVIAAHHSQLDFGCIPALERVLRGAGEPVDADGNTFSLFGVSALQEAAAVLQREVPLPQLRSALPSGPQEDAALAEMLFTRFLLSALADADYSSSAEHFDPAYLAEHTGPAFVPEAALERLFALRAQKQSASTAAAPLNRLRDRLFEDCLAAAERPPGLFTLTAPTGLGKTLSLFAFAAKHCAHYGKRRIILILPYLAIVEQNVQDYRQVEPNLLESHSAAQLDDASRLLSERWAAPCIVTTNVGFFEPLFSARPTDCRRLHQIANSVIVLDEAQSLPPQLLDATLRTVKLLCEQYGCTVVFSTATQPSFGERPGLSWKPREIVPQPQALFRATQRVTYDWRLSQRTALPRLAQELLQAPAGCAILNLRAHARKLFRELCERGNAQDVFYLTTDLCPAHRRRVLEEIRTRTREGRPCYLAATSCIEAGVDLDYPVVYRALAPLESIIQAAGRCNRNGDSPTGRVVVFVPDEERLYPPGPYYEQAANCVRTLAARHPIDCADLAHIREYYALLYAHADGDKPALRQAIREEDFAAVQAAYRLIERKGVQVIVPYPEEAELFAEIRAEYDRSGLTPALLQKARPLTVSSFDTRMVRDTCVPLYFRAPEPGGEPAQPACYLLGNRDLYDDKTGLCLEHAAEMDFVL